MAELPNTITVYRGDSWPIVVTITDSTTGLPLNINAYSFKLTVDRKQNPIDTTTKVFETSGLVIDASNGQVRFTPSAANHAVAGNFFYDIQMTAGASTVKTIVKSQYIIEQDISK